MSGNLNIGELQEGARVRIKKADAESWLMPERKFAREGRVGTIIAVPKPPYGNQYYRVEFDVRRKGAKPHISNVSLRDVELVLE